MKLEHNMAIGVARDKNIWNRILKTLP